MSAHELILYMYELASTESTTAQHMRSAGIEPAVRMPHLNMAVRLIDTARALGSLRDEYLR